MANRVGPMPFITLQDRKANNVNPVSSTPSMPVRWAMLEKEVNKNFGFSPTPSPINEAEEAIRMETDRDSEKGQQTPASKVVQKKRGRKKKVVQDSDLEPGTRTYVSIPLKEKKSFQTAKYMYSMLYDTYLSNTDMFRLMLDSFFEKYLKDIQNAVLGKRAAR